MNNRIYIPHLRKKFLLTLVACDMDYAKFAKIYGVSRQYISQIMNGQMQVSPRILTAIQKFIQKNESKIHSN